jgi:hypothetical protein
VLQKSAHHCIEKVEKEELHEHQDMLESIIAQRINDLTKTHDLLSVRQMSERKNRSCETTLKLLIEQIHTV